MIVPEFLRFYSGYTAGKVLDEMAKTFFSLVNSMYRLQAQEQISFIEGVVVGNAEPKQRSSAISALQKSAKGLHGIVQEVRSVKNGKH